MSRELPILFNAEMVRAILAGKKTCTRRLPNGCVREKYFEYDDWANTVGGSGIKKLRGKEFYEQYPPYQPGDILYVRETWHKAYNGEKYFYLADKMTNREDRKLLDYNNVKWHPSIHMPKEAARIWLKVTDVRVERLQDIDGKGCVKEGIKEELLKDVGEEFVKGMYHDLWDSTIKKSDIDRYGWKANPWVWVIEFERCDKEGRVVDGR